MEEERAKSWREREGGRESFKRGRERGIVSRGRESFEREMIVASDRGLRTQRNAVLGFRGKGNSK